MGTSIEGYDKIVDGTNRVLNGYEKIKNALKDGIQIMDGFVVLGVYEDVKPVFTNGKAIANQIKDLDPDEARAVYVEVARIRGTDVDNVEKVVLGALDVLSDSYDFVVYTVKRGKAIAKKATAIFDGL